MLRDLRVPVHVAENELPEIDDLTDRLVEVARRLGLRLVTCSGQVKEAAKRRGVAVTDLRPLANDLTPDHMPGEQLVLDLIKEGNQPRQAAGYLADGDLVVVNDASHMIGRENVVDRGALDPAHQPGPARVRQAGRPVLAGRIGRRAARTPGRSPTLHDADFDGTEVDVEQIGVDR